MLTTYFSHLFCAAALLKSIHAQKSVPADLSVGFQPESISMQASFSGDASEGFADGTKFTKDQVANAPTFAFGDSSGISTTAKYTLLMLDTTCDNARTLHFLQTDFAYDGTVVDIASSTKPLQAYQAPGAFKETGNGRKYTFLMYNQPGNKNISSLKLPNQGDVIDVKQFQDDNGYVDAQAGLGMVVDLGGTTNCGGAASSAGASSAGQLATSVPASSAAASSAAASSSAAVSRASSADSESPSATAAASSSTGEAAATTVAPGLTTATGAPGGQSSGLVAASSVLGGNSKTTLAVSTTGKAGAASSTASGTAPATQTGSEAANLSLTMARCVVVASLIAFAGLLAF